MEDLRTVRCGNSKYYVIERNGFLIVRRQDWLERTFIGFARDIEEVVALIRRDSRSGEIRAA
jgi:hypothetical protein